MNDNIISLKQIEKPFIVPKYELFIKKDLKFSCAVYGWLLPENHELYMKYNRSVKRITVTNLLNEICRYLLCEGADIKQVKLSDDVINHVIPLEVDINQPNPIHVKEVQRSKKCVVLYFDSTLNHCPVCKEAIKKQQLKDKRFAKNIKTTAKPNAPLSNTHPEKVKLALINERIKCSQFEKDIARMKSEIKLSGITLSPDLSNDVVKIMNENQSKVTSFVKLFWEQQKAGFKNNPKAVHYHPMVVYFCITFAFRWHQNHLQPMMK